MSENETQTDFTIQLTPLEYQELTEEGMTEFQLQGEFIAKDPNVVIRTKEQ